MSYCQRDGRLTCIICKQRILDYIIQLAEPVIDNRKTSLKMATCYPYSNSLETLPDEIILIIFSHLTVKDLGRCALVSKNFYSITSDKTLWIKILVTSCIPPQKFEPSIGYVLPQIMSHRLLILALSRGVKYLGISHLRFITTSQLNFPPKNQVEYLDLTGSYIDENYFRQLMLSCHSLIKLSVANPCGAWKSKDLLKGIFQNSNSLKVLDLSGCHKLTDQDIKSILSNCLNLTEVNLSFSWWTLQVCLKYLQV